MKLQSSMFMLLALALFSVVGCTYSQLTSIKYDMKRDIENKVTIEWASINRLNPYGFSKKLISDHEGNIKWLFSNPDGCEIVYTTYTDSDGDSIVSGAIIQSDESNCEKRIRYSHHP
jgi:hypothetical protein